MTTVKSRCCRTFRVSLALTIAAALAIAAPCSATPAAPLRVGIAPIYPPLAFKMHGQLKGIEPAFAERLGAALGRPVTFVELGWEELIPALRDGKVDVVMSGMSITDERKQSIAFTDPYLRIGQMALIRDADYLRLREPSAMNQPAARVGFLSGTTSEAYARANLDRAQLHGFPSTEDGVAALRNEQIDFWIQDAPAVWRITGGVFSKETQLRGLYAPLTEEYLAWGVRQDDDALRRQLDGVLAKWKQNGTLDDVIDDWITVRKTSIEVKPLSK